MQPEQPERSPGTWASTTCTSMTSARWPWPRRQGHWRWCRRRPSWSHPARRAVCSAAATDISAVSQARRHHRCIGALQTYHPAVRQSNALMQWYCYCSLLHAAASRHPWRHAAELVMGRWLGVSNSTRYRYCVFFTLTHCLGFRIFL